MMSSDILTELKTKALDQAMVKILCLLKAGKWCLTCKNLNCICMKRYVIKPQISISQMEKWHKWHISTDGQKMLGQISVGGKKWFSLVISSPVTNIANNFTYSCVMLGAVYVVFSVFE